MGGAGARLPPVGLELGLVGGVPCGGDTGEPQRHGWERVSVWMGAFGEILGGCES
jgi:hypothetical protein